MGFVTVIALEYICILRLTYVAVRLSSVTSMARPRGEGACVALLPKAPRFSLRNSYFGEQWVRLFCGYFRPSKSLPLH
jgi:hypothetical protein